MALLYLQFSEECDRICANESGSVAAISAAMAKEDSPYLLQLARPLDATAVATVGASALAAVEDLGFSFISIYR